MSLTTVHTGVKDMGPAKKKLVRWINTNPGAARDESGYWRSNEGRFEIWPLYRSTIYPSHYAVCDNLKAHDTSGRFISKTSFDTVRECKQWAEDIVGRELRELA